MRKGAKTNLNTVFASVSFLVLLLITLRFFIFFQPNNGKDSTPNDETTSSNIEIATYSPNVAKVKKNKRATIKPVGDFQLSAKVLHSDGPIPNISDQGDQLSIRTNGSQSQILHIRKGKILESFPSNSSYYTFTNSGQVKKGQGMGGDLTRSGLKSTNFADVRSVSLVLMATVF